MCCVELERIVPSQIANFQPIQIESPSHYSLLSSQHSNGLPIPPPFFAIISACLCRFTLVSFKPNKSTFFASIRILISLILPSLLPLHYGGRGCRSKRRCSFSSRHSIHFGSFYLLAFILTYTSFLIMICHWI